MIVSTKKNRYYYDLQNRSVMLLHPDLAEELKNNITGTPSPRPESDYYRRKLQFLSQYGQLNEDECRKIEFHELQASEVREALANTKQMTFELTDRCNLQCQYCGYGSLYSAFDQRDHTDMSFDTAKAVLDHQFELWNSALNRSHENKIYISFYGGEPLMNFPLIEQIICYIESLPALHNLFSYTMTTNGLLLDKYSDFLARHKVSLLISLDGNERNNSYRVTKNNKPSFDKIIENIEKLRKDHPDYYEESVNFNAVFHNRNSVEEIHKFFKETFGKFPAVRQMSTSGINQDKKKEFWIMYANVSDSLREAEDYSVIERDMLVKLPDSESLSFFLQYSCSFGFHDYNELLGSKGEVINRPSGTCMPFSKKIFVTAKGALLPCEKISFNHYLGEVKDGKVQLDYQEIADRYNEMYRKILRMCSRCFNNHACLQCLFHLSKDGAFTTCQGFMNDKEYLHKVAEDIAFTSENPDIYSEILRNVVVE